jgi:hypothetical protein
VFQPQAKSQVIRIVVVTCVDIARPRNARLPRLDKTPQSQVPLSPSIASAERSFRCHCGPSKFSRLEDQRTLLTFKRLRWLGWSSTYYKADCLSARYARDERPESDLSTLGTTMTLRQRSISSRIGLLASQALEHRRMVSIAVCFVVLLELTRLYQQVA